MMLRALPCDPMDPYCDDPLPGPDVTRSNLVSTLTDTGYTPPFVPSSSDDAGSVDFVELPPTVIHGNASPTMPAWGWVAAGLAALWALGQGG